MFEGFDLPLDGVVQTQVGVENQAALRVKLFRGKCRQPSAARRAEQFVEGHAEQPDREQAVDAVANRGAVAHQGGAAAGQLTQQRGGFVGLPDLRQIITAQQLRQHFGVDLIGLDLRLSDGLGGQRIAGHHLGHEGAQEPRHGPGIRGRFQSDAILRREHRAREIEQLFAVEVFQPLFDEHFALGVDDADLQDAFVDIEADET